MMLIWRSSLPWLRMRFALRWRTGFDPAVFPVDGQGTELVHQQDKHREFRRQAVKIALTCSVDRA